MSPPNKKIFVFDIDETILWKKRNPKDINEVPISLSTYSPYPNNKVYTINKDFLSEMMRDILTNNDQIAFITKGGIQKDQMLEFCKQELGIALPQNTIYFSREPNKTQRLIEISQEQKIDRKDIILIDNSKKHIDSAKKSGFSVIRVDTNWDSNQEYGYDHTDGNTYKSKLKQLIQERKNEIAQAKEARNNAARIIPENMRSQARKTAFLKAREARENILNIKKEKEFNENINEIRKKEKDYGLDESFSKSLEAMNFNYANKQGLSPKKKLLAKSFSQNIAKESVDFLKEDSSTRSLLDFKKRIEALTNEASEIKKSRTFGRKALNFVFVVMSAPLLGVPLIAKKIRTGSTLFRSDGGSRLKQVKDYQKVFMGFAEKNNPEKSKGLEF